MGHLLRQFLVPKNPLRGSPGFNGFADLVALDRVHELDRLTAPEAEAFLDGGRVRKG